MPPRIGVFIAHAAFSEERRGTLARLREQIGPGADVAVTESVTHERPSVWFRRLLDRAVEGDHDVAILLNDDAQVCPRFVDVVGAMVEATNGQQILGLQSVHASASTPETRWVRSAWPNGVATAWPREHLQALRSFWRDTPTVECCAQRWCPWCAEDALNSAFLYSTGRLVWDAIPSVVRHDDTRGSLYEHNGRHFMATHVTWESFPDADLTSREFWSGPVADHVAAVDGRGRKFMALREWARWKACLLCSEREATDSGGYLCDSCSKHRAAIDPARRLAPAPMNGQDGDQSKPQPDPIELARRRQRRLQERMLVRGR